MCRYEEEHFLRLSHPGGRHGEGGRATRDVMEELTDFSALKGLTKEERVRIIYHCDLVSMVVTPMDL